MKAKFVIAAALLGIVAFGVFLRLPMIEDMFCNPDLAVIAYCSQELLSGGAVYDQCADTKTPGSYFLFAWLFRTFGRSMSSVYFNNMLWHAIVLLCLFLIARSIVSTKAGLAAAFFYAWYSISQASDGICPDFESWTLMPLAVGFWAVWRFTATRDRRWLALVGFCASLALLFKQTSVVFLVFALVPLWLARQPREAKWPPMKPFVVDLLICALAALPPIVATVLFFHSRHGLAAMWHALNPGSVVGGYMSSEPLSDVWARIKENFGYFVRHSSLLLLFAALGVTSAWRSRKNVDRPLRWAGYRLALFWLLGAFGAIVIGTKFFNHYFVLIMPPLALLAGLGIADNTLVDRRPRLAGAALVLLALAGGFANLYLETGLAAQVVKDYLKVGHQTWNEDHEYFWSRIDLSRHLTSRTYLVKVGQCISAHTKPTETILVWDYIPDVYWHADRRSPTRHFVYFEVATEMPPGAGRWYSKLVPPVRRARDEMIRDLERQPPAYIVRVQDNTQNLYRPYFRWNAPLFPELAAFAAARYEPDPVCSSGLVVVLKRKDSVGSP